ncbi:diketogulonate reductase-like aldo/keto reductase [Stackebrandtia albiflava]|uniref:Diketogulonate reductase-like aldo/keto reductase n=1 Tax=Stackebrandtia albiflava TaxID=406432 RepID=A0A562VDK1_9ACTN|nr:aldo/keto reductase [Stackebrandtia albiflava]TWJ15966.1 diketogulonate reductase-like aldo/keto reductase [Stackebrandtia albiflava]
MNHAPTVTLNNDVTMPQLGFGVWQVSDTDTVDAVARALSVGYRAVDTAGAYGNEAGVGRAIAASGLDRGDVFITTKLANPHQGYENTMRAFEKSLQELGTDYVDLYLIHWPMPARDLYTDTWRAFERLYRDGHAKAIGVSNFEIAQLDRLANECTVTPAVNQIELHPHLVQDELRRYHAAHDIATEAWSPLGQGGDLLQDPVISRIAAGHGKTPAQVVIRWHLQLGNITIPKSVTPSRIAENFDVFDFTLTDTDMADITGLPQGHRLGPDPAVFQ